MSPAYSSVTSVAWVQVPLLSFCWHFNTKYCFLDFEQLHKVSSTIIHANEHTIYRQDDRVVRYAGLRHQSPWCRGFETHSCHFNDILYKVLFPLLWTPAHGIFYHNPFYWSHNIQAEWLSGLNRRLSLQWFLWRGFKSHSCHFLNIPIQNIISCILNTCTWYLLSSSRLLTRKHTGRMAEWLKALV